jgi:hypothetical protein
MTIAELGAMGEFVGSLGVIATLFYLAIQIRANTKTTRASASFDAIHSWAQLNENIAIQLDDFHAIMLQATDDSTKADVFSETEWQKISLLNRAVMQKLEGQYYLYKYGLMEPDIWIKRSSAGRGFIEPPAQRQWWEEEKFKRTFTEAFVAAIESAEKLAVPGSAINRRTA